MYNAATISSTSYRDMIDNSISTASINALKEIFILVKYLIGANNMQIIKFS